MMDEIRFEVGGKYENMKGVFEVIAMRRDSMDIRWESGEEISTPIELQQRILERMQHEKEMEEAKALQKAKKAKAASSKAGRAFTGLEASDFSNTVSKTSWRGRGQLGGAVAVVPGRGGAGLPDHDLQRHPLERHWHPPAAVGLVVRRVNSPLPVLRYHHRLRRPHG